jgi:hypothetical protein
MIKYRNPFSKELTIELSKEADSKLFKKFINILINMDAELWRVLDHWAWDQKYYDFKIGKHEFCLHYEHYLGIMVYSKNKESEKILEELASKLLVVLK